MRKLLLTAGLLLSSTQIALAGPHYHGSHGGSTLPDESPETLPVLIVGASFANGKAPFDGDLSSPLLGLSVGTGQYISLGDALIRNRTHSGYVVNEAQASATTFARESCRTALYAGGCSTAETDSYQTQVLRASSRVYSLASGAYNAEYVVVTAPNDCLHSDAFGLPESDAKQCDEEDMQDVADRMVEIGQLVIGLGMTPVFAPYPDVSTIDLELFRQSSLLEWTISPTDYQMLNNIVMTTLASDLPDGLIIDYWAEYAHIGDGIHPDLATVENAADMILEGIGYNVIAEHPRNNGRGHKHGHHHRDGHNKRHNRR